MLFTRQILDTLLSLSVKPLSHGADLILISRDLSADPLLIRAEWIHDRSMFQFLQSMYSRRGPTLHVEIPLPVCAIINAPDQAVPRSCESPHYGGTLA